jgi:hypothetical protein
MASAVPDSKNVLEWTPEQVGRFFTGKNAHYTKLANIFVREAVDGTVLVKETMDDLLNSQEAGLSAMHVSRLNKEIAALAKAAGMCLPRDMRIRWVMLCVSVSNV